MTPTQAIELIMQLVDDDQPDIAQAVLTEEFIVKNSKHVKVNQCYSNKDNKPFTPLPLLTTRT